MKPTPELVPELNAEAMRLAHQIQAHQRRGARSPEQVGAWARVMRAALRLSRYASTAKNTQERTHG